jgi:hypothetical protein
VVVERLFVSAATGEGLAPLRQSLSERVGRLMPLEKQDDSMPLEIPAQSTDQTP